MNYLELTYGRIKFINVFTKVKELDAKFKGEIKMDEYQKVLKTWLTPEEVKNDLQWFLALWRTQQEASK